MQDSNHGDHADHADHGNHGDGAEDSYHQRVDNAEIVGGGHFATNQDSWVDALVTLLATVVFGLGWTLVELERADPPPNRYDAAASELWIAAVASSIDARAMEVRTDGSAWTGRLGDENTRWTERAPGKSNR